jgi:MFS family permease
MRRPSVSVIFLTVFIDLIGFGIVLPLIPLYSRNLAANSAIVETLMQFFGPGAIGLVVGAIGASFSLMQFLFAPSWGKLSDRIGRRPVLLVSTAGSAISYALFAMGSGWTGDAAICMLLGSRIFAGICGANITVAQAYIADISLPEERSKKMGLIGMAFGLGFVCGPPLGSLGIYLLGFRGPGLLAMGLCTANFFLALRILSESWKPSSQHVAGRPHLEQWVFTLRQPKIGLLIIVFFLATFCFASFETTLGLLISENFHLNKETHQDMKLGGLLIGYCGLIGALVQGGAIGRLVKRSGEPRLIANSMFLLAVSLAPLPFIHGNNPTSWALLLVTLAVLAIGSSLTRPPVFGLISVLTPAHEQGATIGVAQGAGSLARILGQLFAAILLFVKPALPYLICSGISLVTGILVVQYLCRDAQPSLAGGAPNPAK